MSPLQHIRQILADFRRRSDTLDIRTRRMDARLSALEELALLQAEAQLGALRGENAAGALAAGLERLRSTPSAPAEDVAAAMPYHSLQVQGCTYFYHPGDATIPGYMRSTGRTYGEESLCAFLRQADRLSYGGKGPETGVFLEIGANIGTTTVYCKRKLKPALRVLAFEPVEENARLLAANCCINGIAADVTVVPVALSDREREDALIYVNPENRAGSALVESWEKPGEVQHTGVTTLDSYLRRHGGAGDIRYAWIDTEGHEFEVLRGAASLFGSRRIPTCLEFNQGVYRAVGSYEAMLETLSAYFGCFMTADEAAGHDPAPRPLAGLSRLWEEYGGESCDIFLF